MLDAYFSAYIMLYCAVLLVLHHYWRLYMLQLLVADLSLAVHSRGCVGVWFYMSFSFMACCALVCLLVGLSLANL